MVHATQGFKYKWAPRVARVCRLKTVRLAERLFKDIDGPHFIEVPFYGFTLRLDISRSNAQKLLFLERERFVRERHLITRLLRPGIRVVDVGANIGYYMLMFQSVVGSGGQIICVEPEPHNLIELKGNVECNRFSNVQIIEAAAGSSNGTVSLACGINGIVREQGDGDINVNTVTLDSLVDGKVDLIKIDVEGYEAHVLLGAECLIKTWNPVLFVEIHPHLLLARYTVAAIFEFLNRHYGHIALYERRQERSILDRIESRYLGRDVVRIEDGRALIAECAADRRRRPFWAICQ
jgi:FkbM family methyltransferase